MSIIDNPQDVIKVLTMYSNHMYYAFEDPYAVIGSAVAARKMVEIVYHIVCKQLRIVSANSKSKDILDKSVYEQLANASLDVYGSQKQTDAKNSLRSLYIIVKAKDRNSDIPSIASHMHYQGKNFYSRADWTKAKPSDTNQWKKDRQSIFDDYIGYCNASVKIATQMIKFLDTNCRIWREYIGTNNTNILKDNLSKIISKKDIPTETHRGFKDSYKKEYGLSNYLCEALKIANERIKTNQDLAFYYTEIGAINRKIGEMYAYHYLCRNDINFCGSINNTDIPTLEDYLNALQEFNYKGETDHQINELIQINIKIVQFSGNNREHFRLDSTVQDEMYAWEGRSKETIAKSIEKAGDTINRAGANMLEYIDGKPPRANILDYLKLYPSNEQYNTDIDEIRKIIRKEEEEKVTKELLEQEERIHTLQTELSDLKRVKKEYDDIVSERKKLEDTIEVYARSEKTRLEELEELKSQKMEFDVKEQELKGTLSKSIESEKAKSAELEKFKSEKQELEDALKVADANRIATEELKRHFDEKITQKEEQNRQEIKQAVKKQKRRDRMVYGTIGIIAVALFVATWYLFLKPEEPVKNMQVRIANTILREDEQYSVSENDVIICAFYDTDDLEIEQLNYKLLDAEGEIASKEQIMVEGNYFQVSVPASDDKKTFTLATSFTAKDKDTGKDISYTKNFSFVYSADKNMNSYYQDQVAYTVSRGSWLLDNSSLSTIIPGESLSVYASAPVGNVEFIYLKTKSFEKRIDGSQGWITVPTDLYGEDVLEISSDIVMDGSIIRSEWVSYPIKYTNGKMDRTVIVTYDGETLIPYSGLTSDEEQRTVTAVTDEKYIHVEASNDADIMDILDRCNNDDIYYSVPGNVNYDMLLPENLFENYSVRYLYVYAKGIDGVIIGQPQCYIFAKDPEAYQPITLKVYYHGELLGENTVIHAKPGDELIVEAMDTSGYGISRIGWYTRCADPRTIAITDVYNTSNIIITLPSDLSVSSYDILIEAIGNQDVGSFGLETKTGWKTYSIIYDDIKADPIEIRVNGKVLEGESIHAIDKENRIQINTIGRSILFSWDKEGEILQVNGSAYVLSIPAEFKEGEIHSLYITIKDENETWPVVKQWFYIKEAGLEKSEVDMYVYMEGILIEPDIVYAVRGGETIEARSRSDQGIAFIGYYFNEDNENSEIIDVEGGYLSLTLPEKQSGERITLFIEAVANNDTGLANSITKTGWRKFVFEY